MDNVCHTLVGAALGRAGLARPTPLGMSTLLIAANLPDVDAAVFATNTLAVSFRRGWTHGVLAQVLLPLALVAAMAAWDRFRRRSRGLPPPPHGAPDAQRGPRPVRLGELALLAYVGVLSHVYLDCLNSYGIRLLMPFSGRWFYGDALFIMDPWMWLTLGVALWLAAQRARAGHPAPERPVQIGLALTALYTIVMLGSNVAARAVVAEGLERAGRPVTTRFMVTPVVVNPFRREVVIDLGERYEKGTVWFEPLPHFRPGGYGIDTHLGDPEVQQALATPRARAYLVWSRFPFAAVDRTTSPPRVWLNDYRYANTGPGGWSRFLTEVPQ